MQQILEEVRLDFFGRGRPAVCGMAGTIACLVTAKSAQILGIPLKVNIDFGGKPNGIPERR